MTVVGAMIGLSVGIPVRRLVTVLAGRTPARGWCELACGGVGAAAMYAPGPTLAMALFGWWCVAASCVDLLVHRLPNILTLGGGVLVFLAALSTGHGRSAAVGALLLVTPLIVLHLVSPRSLGAGDVKLGIGLGAVAGMVGAHAVLLTAVLPFVLTAAAGGLLAARHALSGGRYVSGRVLPHGPSMCCAAVAGLLTGL